MNNYIVRLWVDVKIQAESENEAKQIANGLPVEIQEDERVECYDIQTAQVWSREELDND